MIVCSCNVLTDQDVRSMLSGANAVRTVGEIYGCLGCSVLCGRCAPTIRRILNERLSEAALRATKDTSTGQMPNLDYHVSVA
jgi:bacterioferritin-associated ferredoxin